MKKVLITGGAGYVGTVLTSKLLYNFHKVRIFDLMLYGNEFAGNPDVESIRGDIRDGEAVARALDGIDTVIHLACISNDPSFELNPALGRSINLTAFSPLVKAAKSAGVRRFINASSSSVYGVSDEPEVTENTKCKPLTDYSQFKLLCEDILNNHSSTDFETVSVRSATVCGYSPRQRLDVIVNILTNQAYFKREMLLMGGTQLRPNIDINDIADFYAALINADSKIINGQTFNYGYENYSLEELAQLVASCFSNEIKITKKKTDDLRSYHISSDKAKAAGFWPKRTIQNSVTQLIVAFKTGLLIDTFDNPKYYNIKMMQKLNLE